MLSFFIKILCGTNPRILCHRLFSNKSNLLSIIISPSVGFINPKQRFINVVFPDPLGPKIPYLSLLIFKFMSLNTFLPLS